LRDEMDGEFRAGERGGVDEVGVEGDHVGFG
jgi:hypothetical protein